MSDPILPPRLEKLAARIEETLPPPSAELRQTLLLLSGAYQANGECLKSAETLARAIKALCSPSADSILPMIKSPSTVIEALTAAHRFYAQGRIWDGDLWRLAAKKCALQTFCNSPALIKHFYSEVKIVRHMTDFFDQFIICFCCALSRHVTLAMLQSSVGNVGISKVPAAY